LLKYRQNREISSLAWFGAFDKIKKLNGNLFHFGECTKVAHNSKDKVIYLLRDSTVYVSIYLRVRFSFISREPMMLYLSKNHEGDIKSAVLVAAVTPDIDGIKLVRLHGKLSIKASEDLMLYSFSTDLMKL